MMLWLIMIVMIGLSTWSKLTISNCTINLIFSIKNWIIVCISVPLHPKLTKSLKNVLKVMEGVSKNTKLKFLDCIKICIKSYLQNLDPINKWLIMKQNNPIDFIFILNWKKFVNYKAWYWKQRTLKINILCNWCIIQFLRITLFRIFLEALDSSSHILLNFTVRSSTKNGIIAMTWRFDAKVLTYHHCWEGTYWQPYKMGFIFFFLLHLQYSHKFQKHDQKSVPQICQLHSKQGPVEQCNHIPMIGRNHQEIHNSDKQFWFRFEDSDPFAIKHRKMTNIHWYISYFLPRLNADKRHPWYKDILLAF